MRKNGYLRLVFITIFSVFNCFPSYSEECPDMKASYTQTGHNKPFDYIKIWMFNIDPASKINLKKSLVNILSKKLPDPKYLCINIGLRPGSGDVNLRCTDQRNNLTFNTSTYKAANHMYGGPIYHIPDKNGNLININGTIESEDLPPQVNCSSNSTWVYILRTLEWEGPPVTKLPFVMLGAYVWKDTLRIEPYKNIPQF